MEAIKQLRLRGYGRVNSDEDNVFRRNTKHRLALILLSTILLLAIAISLTVSSISSKRNTSYGSYHSQSPPSTSLPDTIKALCGVTRYPDLCYSTFALSNGSTVRNDPIELFKLSLRAGMEELSNISSLTETFIIPLNDKRLSLAIKDCKEVLSDAIDRFNDSISLSESKSLSESTVGDLRSWLSAAVTDQETCIDGFEGTSGSVRDKLQAAMVNSTKLTSNNLAIATGILGILQKLNFKIHRKLLADGGIERGKRRLYVLRDPTRLKPNVTVAKDGSGLVQTIAGAISLVPRKSEDPFVIHVKEGVYRENVVVTKDKWNVIVIGDGMNKTLVDGSLNFADGTPVFSTATFAVAGKRFMATDMGFRNSAGPTYHQAVALRSSSDQSIFYRCSFNGFETTLYTHSLRQFYRDCEISGTTDFIFGDAAVVFQNCTIRPRQSLPGQLDTITAQGKKDPNESTGISIQGSKISPYANNVTVRAFLGRPLKEYSTVVVMQSEIGSVVDPKGWVPSVIGSGQTDTVSFSEYGNTGPGSDVMGRIKCAGYRPAISAEEAGKYTVESFLNGSDWITDTGVVFEPNLD